MKTFKIDKSLSVVCEFEKTRSGFRHVAKLLKNDWETIEQTKACYLNRTWESFEFESVLKKILDLTDLSKTRKKNILIKASGRELKRIKKQTKQVNAIASLGDLFCKTDKDSNDWKLKMLIAGNPGLTKPEDWDTLSEATKKERLDNIINNNIIK